MTATGTIRLRRARQYMGGARAFKVLVDGQRIGTLRVGGELTHDTAVGEHVVRVEMDWIAGETRVVVGPEGLDLECGADTTGVLGKMGLRAFTAPKETLYVRAPGQTVPAPAPVSPSATPPRPPPPPSSRPVPAGATSSPTILDDRVERVVAARIPYKVPAGVTVEISKSRTIEHTVEVSASTGGSGSLGFASLGASIKAEIGRSQGRSYGESETETVTISLTGTDASDFELVWIDVWRVGRAAVDGGAAIGPVQFRFRERTELEVHSITS